MKIAKIFEDAWHNSISIAESVRPAPLYHGTSLYGLIGILYSDTMTTPEFEERILGEPKGIVSCLIGVKIMDIDKFNKYADIVLDLDPKYAEAFKKARALRI